MPALPYRGIQAFRYVDHAIFFAREEETRRLASLVAVYRGVLLYGDSGNGKSSLINAGLLPDIVALGFQAERVRVQPREGEELVIERIATADEDDREYLPSRLASGDDESARVVLSTEVFEERVREACASDRPLIIFDQFEEILTLFEEPGAQESQRRIVELLVRLLHDPLPVKILLSFREDYLGRVKQLLAACPELVDQALRLGPPAPDALPTIIRGPFERYPGHFERELDSELAERLRGALADRFGSGDLSLSEVQTVCLRLWQSADPRALLDTRGVQGLLEDYLGEALDAFAPEQRNAAIALLAQMVTSAGTRNVISADDLLHRVREEDDIPERRLEQALQRLESESKLVRRERRRNIYLYEITSEFLVPWISERRNEAQRLQDRRRERRRAAVFLIVAAALAGIAVLAIEQRSAAQRQETAGRSLGLTAASSTQLGSRPDVALLLAFEAFARSPRPEARSSVIAALPAARGSGALGILHGHGSTVYGVAFSPDGRVIASSSDDRTLRLWDTRTHRQLGEPLAGHTGPVYGLAFSPDGRMLASAGDDGTVRLWNARSRKPLARLTGHEDAVWSVAFSPDGRTLVSASDDGNLRLWDVRKRLPLGTLIGHVGAVYEGDFSPDGRLVASGGKDKTVRLWDARTRRQVGRRMRGHKERVVGLAFRGDGRVLASASFDDTIRLWDVATHRLIGTLEGHDSAAYSVAFSPDGRTLATTSADRTVRLWNARDLRQVGTITGHGGTIFGVAFSPDGRMLASGANDATIRLVDLRTQAGRHLGHRRGVRSVAFSPDGRTLASGGNDDRVRLWDVQTHRPVGTLRGHSRSVLSVAFSPSGKTVASGAADHTVRLWDVSSRRPLGRLTGAGSEVRAVAFSPDGRTLAAAGDGRTIHLWNVGSGRPLGTLETVKKPVYGVAFAADGTLVSGAGDDLIHVWDVAAMQERDEPLRNHSDHVFRLAFAPDGQTLASASYDNTIRLWDVRRRRQLGAPLTGHTDPVNGVAFSPDGRTLASSSQDRTVRLWSAATHKQTAIVSGHVGSVFGVAFGRDGTLATAGSDGVIRLLGNLLWRDVAELRRTVCAFLGAGLSRDEWDRYGAGIPYQNSCA